MLPEQERQAKKTPIKGDKIGVPKSLISEGFPLREEKREAIISPAIRTDTLRVSSLSFLIFLACPLCPFPSDIQCFGFQWPPLLR